MSRPPKLSTTGFDAVGKGTVIVGGGSGAFQALESLREVGNSVLNLCHSDIEVVCQHGYKYPITILSKEPHSPIDRLVQFLWSYLTSLPINLVLQDKA